MLLSALLSLLIGGSYASLEANLLQPFLPRQTGLKYDLRECMKPAMAGCGVNCSRLIQPETDLAARDYWTSFYIQASRSEERPAITAEMIDIAAGIVNQIQSAMDAAGVEYRRNSRRCAFTRSTYYCATYIYARSEICAGAVEALQMSYDNYLRISLTMWYAEDVLFTVGRALSAGCTGYLFDHERPDCLYPPNSLLVLVP